MRQIALSYPVVVGPPTGTDRETQLLSLIRRFTAFTRGCASVPSYGGNACINYRWVNYYIIAKPIVVKIISNLKKIISNII